MSKKEMFFVVYNSVVFTMGLCGNALMLKDYDRVFFPARPHPQAKEQDFQGVQVSQQSEQSDKPGTAIEVKDTLQCSDTTGLLCKMLCRKM